MVRIFRTVCHKLKNMEKINNVKDAKKHVGIWCDKFHRTLLDLDDVDNKYLCLTFIKHTMLYKNELDNLMNPFEIACVQTYGQYLEVILYYNRFGKT